MKYFILIVITFLFLACDQKSQPLPIIGQVDIVDGDTINHVIPDFRFLNQDSIWVGPSDFDEHIYIADFFFIACPSICPIVKKQMLRIYESYGDDDLVMLVSHTIDPKRDTPSRLHKYAEGLGVDTKKWMFLTGNKDSLMDIANEYFVAALEDPEAPGGFDHSGKILLVDKNKHIRSFADGTDEKEVTRLIKDIQTLISEYEDSTK